MLSRSAGVGFRIADARAVDREQREAARLHGAEDQHGRGGRRHQPDEADEAAWISPSETMAGLSSPCREHRDGRHRHQAEGDAERQESLELPICANSQGPRGKAQRQHGCVDAEHEAALMRWSGRADPELREDEQHGQREMQHRCAAGTTSRSSARSRSRRTPKRRAGSWRASSRRRRTAWRAGSPSGAEAIEATPAIAVLRPIMRRGMAARFQDDAEQRHAEADGDADHADRGDCRRDRRPTQRFGKRSGSAVHFSSWAARGADSGDG